MKFLREWKIEIEKLPAYALFNKTFTEQIDLHLAQQILVDTDERLTKEIKTEFQKMVNMIDPKTNSIKCKYSPRHNVGRRYADYPEKYLPNKKLNPNYGKYHSALISQPRLIKNTIFKYQNWVDVDQKKGHPTIIYCNAKRLGLDLPAYKEYLTNFNTYVDELTEYYTSDPEYPIDNKDIKLLFNKTIYGGGHKKWAKVILEGEYQKDPKGEFIYDNNGNHIFKTNPRPMKNANRPHEFYNNYFKDTTNY